MHLKTSLLSIPYPQPCCASHHHLWYSVKRRNPIVTLSSSSPVCWSDRHYLITISHSVSMTTLGTRQSALTWTLNFKRLPTALVLRSYCKIYRRYKFLSPQSCYAEVWSFIPSRVRCLGLDRNARVQPDQTQMHEHGKRKQSARFKWTGPDLGKP